MLYKVLSKVLLYCTIVLHFYTLRLLRSEVELNQCPPICPNLPYMEIYVTLPIKDGTEPMIIRMQSGPQAYLWIREDGLNHC